MIPRPTPDAARRPGPKRKPAWSEVWPEAAGLAGLLAVAAFFVSTSWRRWNHPLIDFGRELYLPWRLSEGAVLYRDVDDVYGPLSQYFNAGLFKLFGPGYMVLVTANLVIFAAILALAYTLFRRAWGVAGALASCLVLVSIFGFSQFLVCSNFNYATPYAHEATHGVLVVLALVAALGFWLERPTGSNRFAAGLLAGLTLVLKPEFILAGGAVTLAAVALRWRRAGRISVACPVVFALGAVLPTAAFAVYFSQHFPLFKAVDAACRAWSSLLLHPDIVGKQYQMFFLGLNDPWNNFLAHVRATLVAAGVLGVLGGMIVLALNRRAIAAWLSLTALAVASALAVGLTADWGYIGRCFLGLNLVYLGSVWYGGQRRRNESQSAGESTVGWRVLLGVLAIALMGRMFLNGRIVQFGFFQAALAAMVVVAVMCAESVEWMPPGRGRRRIVLLVAAALLMPGIIWCSKNSQRLLRAQDFPVAAGRDRFYSFPTNLDATGYLVNAVLEILRQFPRDTTLLALPEGPMINYLARLRSPLPQFQFYSWTTEGGRELEVVKALDAHPPDVVVVISRDLGDFGIKIYGERDGAGRQIMQWLAQRYEITHKIGDDPLNSNQRGAYVLQRKSTEAAKN